MARGSYVNNISSADSTSHRTDPCWQARSHREGAHLSQEAMSPFYPETWPMGSRTTPGQKWSVSVEG